MTLWWIGNVVLLLVILPVVVYLLRGVLNAPRSIVPSVNRIAAAANASGAVANSVPILPMPSCSPVSVAKRCGGNRRA